MVHRVTGTLDPLFRSVIHENVVAAAAALNLVIPDGNGSPINNGNDVDLADFVYLGGESTRFRNRPLCPTTKASYEEKFRQLWKFLAIKGDYESMLMLLVVPPPHCPSMNANSLEEFFRFKRQAAGTMLKDDSGRPVLDIHGQTITCDGRWKSPYMDAYKAAVSDLHATNGHTGSYCEPCVDCLALAPDIQYQGCEHHRGQCRLRRCGNPIRCVIFTNTNRQQVIWGDEAGYEEQGCSQMLPSDVRRLRNYYLSLNSIVGLQHWCCTIVAILLALRHDEFHEINDQNFVPSLFEVTDERVDRLVLKILGKSDTRPIAFRLNADNDHPEFCPVRPLLVYMHLINYKGGFLFPDADELRNRPQDGIYKTKVDYDKFNNDLQRVCTQVLPPREEFKVGCHIYRKAYYGMGVFGEAHNGDLQYSARHESMNNSMKYRKSAASVYETYKQMPTPENAVSKWQPTRIDKDGQENLALLLMQRGYKPMLLTEIADFFVNSILRVPTDGRGATKDVIALMDRANTYQIVKTPEEEIKAWMSRLKISDDDAKYFFIQHERMMNRRLAAQQMEFQQHLASGQVDQIMADATMTTPTTATITNVPVETPTTTTTMPIVAIPHPVTPIAGPPIRDEPIDTTTMTHSPPIANRHQKVDLAERKNLKNMRSALEKIEALVRIEDERTTGSLTSGAKTFASKFLKPAINCLNNHFDGDCGRFAAKYEDFNHTTFPTLCCCGEGVVCAPKQM